MNAARVAEGIGRSDAWLTIRYAVGHFLEGHREPVICNLYLNVKDVLRGQSPRLLKVHHRFAVFKTNRHHHEPWPTELLRRNIRTPNLFVKLLSRSVNIKVGLLSWWEKERSHICCMHGNRDRLKKRTLLVIYIGFQKICRVTLRSLVNLKNGERIWV